MDRSWQFELGRVHATTRLGYDFLRSLLWPVRGGTRSGPPFDVPVVAADLGAGEQEALPSALRLVSWNIHRAYDARAVVGSLRSLVAEWQPHLVLLQEVPVYPHGPWWQEPEVRAALAGLSVVYAAMHRVARTTAYYPFRESGLLIAMRARPVSRRALRLPVASHPKLGRDHRVERIALGVVCQAGAQAPEIWNLHLENTARPSGRARQAKAVADALGDGPLIVGGDLNTLFGPLEGAWTALEAAGLARIPLRHGRWLSPAIDHVFVRGAARASGEVLRLPGSDHLPVFAEVELAAPAPGAG